MKIEDRRITLKDGRYALLRNPAPADVTGLLAFMTAVAGETEFIGRYPEECTITEEQEIRWIQNSLESPNKLVLCCFLNNEPVAICDISFHTSIKTRHRAVVAVSVRREQWGLGIGREMFASMLGAAREHGTSVVELEYIDGNERARILYEKLGFCEISRRPDIYRLRDGSSHDEVYMQLRL